MKKLKGKTQKEKECNDVWVKTFSEFRKKPQNLNFFFIHFLAQVQAEEISDEEWRQMMTDDLRRHGVLGQIVDTVPPYIINVDYADHACVHMGNPLFPRQTQLQPHQVK